MPKKDKTQQPYNLEPRFEIALVTLSCCRSTFFHRIGREVNPELLAQEPAKLAMRVVHIISQETGHGSDSLIVVAQHLRTMLEEGKVKQTEIDDVMDMFDDAEDAGLPAEDIIADEMRPILQRKAQYSALNKALDTFGKRGDMGQVAVDFQRAERIGVVDSFVGASLGDFEREVEHLKNLERLPTGILELDSALAGGTERGSAFCFAGGAKEGKSMALIQVCANAILLGFDVAYATLELSKAWTLCRLVANLTGVPIDTLFNGSMQEALRRVGGLENRLGNFRIEWFRKI